MPTEPVPNPRKNSGTPPTSGDPSSAKPEARSASERGERLVLSEAGTSAVPLRAALAGMPQEIGPYRIQRLLGSGGMATVYAALQKQPRRTVALKVMKAGIAHSSGGARGEAALRRFKREIEILGKLHHPYIAAVYDAGTYDDGIGGGPAPYFVMEYIAGALNILEYVVRKDLGLRDKLKLFVKVCAAVEHGHSNKIIHRDLKPGNILIDQYGEPKVIDFGIAHAAEVDSSQQTMTTEAGNLVGTLQYMAPEQVDTRPQDLDGRCDVYALGVLLYKMTTGKPPYDLEALPVFEAIRIIREEQPRRPSDLNSEVKGDLETIILKAMERDRARRYRNAGSLGRDIVRFLANKPINARRAGPAYRARLFVKRNATLLGVAGAIVLIASAAIGYIAWERQRIKNQQASTESELERKERELARRAADVEAARQAGGAAQANAAEPFTLDLHTARVSQVRFVPTAGGEPVLVSTSLDHQLAFWNLQSRSALRQVDPLDAAIDVLASSADGSVLAVAGGRDSDAIAIVRSVDGEVIRTIRDVGEVKSLALGPSGEVVAWGAANFTMSIRPTEARGPLARDDARREPRSIRTSVGAISALAMSTSDRFVAAGAESGAVLIWEPREPSAGDRPRNASPAPPTPPTRLNGLSDSIIALAISEHQDRRLVLAVAADGRAFKWWQDSEAWPGAGWNACAHPVIDASFSPDATFLAVLSADGARVWHVGDGSVAPQPVGSVIEFDDAATSIAIDDSGRWVAVGMHDGDVRVHPVTD